MYFHDDEKGYAVIGEAALSLALSEEEIGADALVRQLDAMAEKEPPGPRLREIGEARQWLLQHRRPGSPDRRAPGWLSSREQEHGQITLAGSAPDSNDDT